MTNKLKEKIKESFNKAEHYERSAFVQKIVAQRLIDRVVHIYEKQKTPIRILEIGCGTGLLTRHLVKQFPNAEFLITDIAPEMVKRAQKHFSASSQKIRFEIVDGELFQCSEQFDLIVSSMTFQWFECLPKALTNLVQCLKPGGILICSTLSDQSFIEWQHIYADQKKPCSLQKYPSMEALQNYWPKIGYGSWEEEFIVCPIKDGKSFLKEFHEIGAKTPRQNSYPLNAGTMRRLIHQFDQKYNSVTYHVAYGFYQRSRLNGVFVTGTDTDVGKTFISACLVKAWSSHYWKPIQTGLCCDQGDSKTIYDLTSVDKDQIIPPAILLEAPLSPENAAQKENQTLDIGNIALPEFLENNIIVVEGAGGCMVPIAQNQQMTDLMIFLGLPVIIVARTKLGTINHTLLTIEHLRKKNIPIFGVILNGDINPDNRRAIEHHGRVKILAEIPHFAEANINTISHCVQLIPSFEKTINANEES